MSELKEIPKYYIKSKTQSGNPLRIHFHKLDSGVILLDKYIYSKQPLRYFEAVEDFPKRFGRTLYRQEIVFSQQLMAELPILSGVYQKTFQPTKTE